MAMFCVTAEKKMSTTFFIEVSFEEEIKPAIVAHLKKARWKTAAPSIECEIDHISEQDDRAQFLARSRIISALRHRADHLTTYKWRY